MAQRGIDWNVIRTEYELTGKNDRVLAAEFRVGESTVQHHRTREKWTVSTNDVDSEKTLRNAEIRLSAEEILLDSVKKLALIVNDVLTNSETAAMVAAQPRQYSATLTDIRQLLDIKSERDIAEQTARIEKLRADVKAIEDKCKDDSVKEIKVVIENGEEYAE